VEQLAARRAHNPKVAGSSPAPATKQIKMELWCRGLTCLPVTQEIAGSNPVSSATCGASVAQQVEQLTCNQWVAGSIPVAGSRKLGY
jgi:hypothetical protein